MSHQRDAFDSTKDEVTKASPPLTTSTAEIGSALEVDPAVLAGSDTEDYASAGYETSIDSLSAVKEYIFGNCRRYHAYFGVDKNFLPAYENEEDRIDFHHEILLQLLDGELHLAPLRMPGRILDIGTRSGIWAIDMADKHPSAEVIGMDLSPVQPAWVPPNCRFEVGDAEEPFTFQDNSFDFVHARNLISYIADWPALVRSIFRVTRPGGWCEVSGLGAELCSNGDPVSKDNGLRKHMDLYRESMAKIGRAFPKSSDYLTDLLVNAGFVDVTSASLKEPIGPWPKDPKMKMIGAMVMLQSDAALEAYGMEPLTGILNMSPAEAQDVVAKARKAVNNKNFHTCNCFLVAYGRKPE